MMLECKLLISKQGNGGRAGTRTPDLMRVKQEPSHPPRIQKDLSFSETRNARRNAGV
jgi:hypothetical protein